jgi:serine/threonine protein phosphatase PrpC
MPSKDNTLEINVFARTDVGMVRAGNEDTFLVLNLNTADCWTPISVDGEPPESLTQFTQGHYGTLLAVSDGMGGALAGEVASRMAVEGVRDRMLQFQAHAAFSPFAFHERLRLAVEQANIHINNESLGNADYAGMGATFTAAGVFNNHLFLAQIGDSRCYLIREGRIQLLTHDQSLVWQLVEAGHITEEEAETHQYKNVILQALGAQPRVNVVVDRVKLRDGDTVLLCSDGLSGRVRSEEMLQTVTSSESLREGCEKLIQFANDRGGDDNITVILAQFRGSALPPSGDLDCERIERDPELPYDVDDSAFATDPDATLPLGSPVDGRTSVLGSPKTAAKTTSKLRQSGAKTSRFEPGDGSLSEGHVAEGVELSASDVANTNGGGSRLDTAEEIVDEEEEYEAESIEPEEALPPPPPPAPMPAAHVARKPSQKRSMGPVVALVTVIVLVGIASAIVYKIQLDRNASASAPQPSPLPVQPPPPPPPDPKVELARTADQLNTTWDGLSERAGKLQPKKKRDDATKRLDDAKKNLDLARVAIESSPTEAKDLLEKVRVALEEFERDFPDPSAPPDPGDGRHNL